MGNLKKKITADTNKEKKKLLSIPFVYDLDPCMDIVTDYKSSNCRKFRKWVVIILISDWVYSGC